MILTVGLGGGVELFTDERLGALYGLNTLEVKEIFDGCRINHCRGAHSHKKKSDLCTFCTSLWP
jgi:hypothetical protein